MAITVQDKDLDTANQPNQPKTQARPQGTGFTNIQRVMQANTGNKVGQAVQSGVTQQAQQAKQGLTAAQQAFGQQIDAQRQQQTQNKQLVEQTLQDPTQALGDSEQAKNLQSQFANIRAGQYTGPTQLQDANRVQAQAQQAEQLGRQAGTEGGRIGLLQQFVGGPQYTQGQQRLDSLLFGAGDQGAKQAIRKETAGLGRMADQGARTAEAIAQSEQGRARALGEETTQRLGKAQEDIYGSEGQEGTIRGELAQAQQAEKDRQAKLENLQRLFRGEVTADEYGQAAAGGLLDYTRTGQWVDGTPNINYSQDYKSNLYTNPVSRDTGTFLGLKEAVKQGLMSEYDANRLGNDLIMNRGNIEKGADISAILNNALGENVAQNVTEASVATPEQRARVNALRALSGQEAAFGGDVGAYQAGQNTFNLQALKDSIQSGVVRQYGINDAEGARKRKQAEEQAASNPLLKAALASNIMTAPAAFLV